MPTPIQISTWSTFSTSAIFCQFRSAHIGPLCNSFNVRRERVKVGVISRSPKFNYLLGYFLTPFYLSAITFALVTRVLWRTIHPPQAHRTRLRVTIHRRSKHLESTQCCPASNHVSLCLGSIFVRRCVVWFRFLGTPTTCASVLQQLWQKSRSERMEWAKVAYGQRLTVQLWNNISTWL